MSSSRLDRRQVLGGSAAALAGLATPALAQPASDGSELKFLVLGDWGRKGDRIQRAVARQMANEAGSFVVTAGDNFYNFGVRGPDDVHWQKSWNGVYDRAKLKTWRPALGNHDYYSARPDAQVRYRAVNPDWDIGGRHYTREAITTAGHKVRLIILDTSPLADPHQFAPTRAAVRAQWEWLDRELVVPADWKIVVGHHFIHSSGASGRDYELLRDGLAPRLRNQGVHAYVAGHDHHLEHLRDDYELPGWGKGRVEYIISGAGAKNDGMRDDRAPGHVNGWLQPGFTTFSFRGDELTVGFVGPDGPIATTTIQRRAPATARA